MRIGLKILKLRQVICLLIIPCMLANQALAVAAHCVDYDSELKTGVRPHVHFGDHHAHDHHGDDHDHSHGHHSYGHSHNDCSHSETCSQQPNADCSQSDCSGHDCDAFYLDAQTAVRACSPRLVELPPAFPFFKIGEQLKTQLQLFPPRPFDDECGQLDAFWVPLRAIFQQKCALII